MELAVEYVKEVRTGGNKKRTTAILDTRLNTQRSCVATTHVCRIWQMVGGASLGCSVIHGRRVLPACTGMHQSPQLDARFSCTTVLLDIAINLAIAYNSSQPATAVHLATVIRTVAETSAHAPTASVRPSSDVPRLPPPPAHDNPLVVWSGTA